MKTTSVAFSVSCLAISAIHAHTFQVKHIFEIGHTRITIHLHLQPQTIHTIAPFIT